MVRTIDELQVELETVFPGLTRFNADRPGLMSDHAYWFQTDTQLIVYPTKAAALSYDSVFAHALAWQQDRDLVFVVQPGHEPFFDARAVWMSTKIRIFTQMGDQVVAHVNRSVTEVLDDVRDLSRAPSSPYQMLAEHRDWLDRITLPKALVLHQHSSWSWHHEGLVVLNAVRQRGGLLIEAGVRYSGRKRPEGRETFRKVFHQPPTDAEAAVISAKVALAIEDDRSGSAEQNEHRMQAHLADQPALLGLAGMLREYPAFRGRNLNGTPRPGFIDFLGWDSRGRLFVVETKIGHDHTVVSQALDYAAWVRSRAHEIRADLARHHQIPVPAKDADRVGVIYAIGAKAPKRTRAGVLRPQPALGPYLAGQLEAIGHEVQIRVLLTKDPLQRDMVLEERELWQLWEPDDLVRAPVTRPRWAERATAAAAKTNA